jgi:hypothetical protein
VKITARIRPSITAYSTAVAASSLVNNCKQRLNMGRYLAASAELASEIFLRLRSKRSTDVNHSLPRTIVKSYSAKSENSAHRKLLIANVQPLNLVRLNFGFDWGGAPVGGLPTVQRLEIVDRTGGIEAHQPHRLIRNIRQSDL